MKKKRNNGTVRAVRGSITVEMAYILPSVILMFLLVVYTVFYYHDKNILNGAAGEIAVVGAQYARQKGEEEPDLQGLFRTRIDRKLILLQLAGVEVSHNKKQIEVLAHAGKGWMRVSVVQRAVIPNPEEKIRRKRQLESLAGKEE